MVLERKDIIANTLKFKLSRFYCAIPRLGQRLGGLRVGVGDVYICWYSIQTELNAWANFANWPMLWSKCWSTYGVQKSALISMVRRYASQGAHDPSKIRNMALVAHIGTQNFVRPSQKDVNVSISDSGKTTLTESILLTSSYLSSSGTVDTGSTTTDFLPVERERGITVQSASIPVQWKDWAFNLVDTPGHADFGMEVESASRVVDGAVVLIDSVEGVESQTRGVWRQLDRCVQQVRELGQIETSY